MGWRENMKMELEVRGLQVIVTATYDTLTNSYQLNRRVRRLGEPTWTYDMPVNVLPPSIIESFHALCQAQLAEHVHFVFNEKLTPVVAHFDSTDEVPV